MGKRYSKEIWEAVLGKMQRGQRVCEVSKAYGINDMMIRSRSERDTTSTAVETIEVSRLRRENEALLRIIGELTYQV